MKNYAVLIYLYIQFFMSILFSQELPTEIINTTNGLSYNKVFSVFQDSYGLLWISTEYGLNVYDGYKFKVFKNDPENPESIMSNVIWHVAEDKENNLWIATGAGVSKYLRAKNKFKNYGLGIRRNYNASMFTYIDLKGNIWASADGEHLRKFNNLTDTWDKQKFVLSDSSRKYNDPAQTLKIIEDKNKKLWIASARFGLMWYDQKENVFRESELMKKDEARDFRSTKKSINWMLDLYADSLGIFWITTINGIYKYNPLTNTLKTIKKYVQRMNMFDVRNSITADQLGNVWITNYIDGLLKFDGITDNYKIMKVNGQNFSNDGVSDINFTSITIDRTGVLWIGTETKGLLKYDPNKKIFTHYTHDENNKNSINHSIIYCLAESKINPQTVYIGTKGGFNLFDTETKNFSNFSFDASNIFGSPIKSILEDEDGSLWLGIWGDGLLNLTPQGKIVKRFVPDYTTFNSISTHQVTALCKDPSGNLWIGTRGGGLNSLDIETNTFNKFGWNVPYPKDIIDLIKNKIDKNLDKAKIIEVGNLQNLSTEFEVENTGNYLVVSAGEGGSSSSLMWDYGWIEDSNNKVIWSSEKVDSTFYIGGMVRNRVKIGILQLNPGKYELKYKSDNAYGFADWIAAPPIEQDFWGIRIFKINDQSELENIQKYLIAVKKELVVKGFYIKAIHVSKNNSIWVGTNRNGLHKINKTDNSVKTYLFDREKKKSRSDISINDICENSDGIIWIATDRGLFEFDSVNETFTKFTDKDGLQANYISSVLPGDNNEIWINTLSGISKMTKKQTKYGLAKGNPTFVNYNFGVALGKDGFDFSSFVKLKTSNGKYYFGGYNGLYEFESGKTNNTLPKLFFSDLKISNVSVLKMDEDLLGKNSLMDIKNLSLSHSQNDLSFEFAALHFSDPKKNKYAHKLEGYEDDWIYDNRRIATYTNLDPGEYTFKFKGSNSDGVWNEEGASINIIINKQWWQTYIAYMAYFLVGFSLIYSFRRYELSRQKLKYNLKVGNLEAEKLKEVDQLKSQFFANISHEFRTPLTLIFGPAKDILENINVKKNAGIIQKNASKLYGLVNQLLDLSKLEAGKMRLETSEQNIIPLLKGLVLSFTSLAERKKITLTFETQEENINIFIDNDKIEKIINNVLSNAFKFTPEGGEVDIKVAKLEKEVEVVVKDTGIGIPEERIGKIFDRFYQVDGSHTREGEGTGIGLALTKELVELHKGNIRAKSNYSDGTTFIIKLQLGKEHLLPEEIVNKESPKEITKTIKETQIISGNEMFGEEDVRAELIEPGTSTNKVNKPHLLIVEDNFDVRNYIISHIEEDYNIQEAEDGEDGYTKSIKQFPDLIVSDVMMPKMDGFQLCEKLKTDERTSHIPVILLTAKATSENKIEGYETGADDYIMKPFDAKELQARIENLINQRKQLRKHFQKEGIFNLENKKLISVDKKFLEKANKIINEHIDDTSFGVELFASNLAISRVALHKKLVALVGESPSELIKRIRLSKAAILLKNNIGNISEIALEVGFNNPAYFSECFKKQFGTTPSQYQRKYFKS